MGSLSFAELTGAEPGVIPVGVPAPRPGGGCCIRDANGMHSLYGRGAAACGGLGSLGGLGGLGDRGWYGTSAPTSTFVRGVRELGGGGLGMARMRMIWAQERPAGFWASPRGRQWKKVTGNLTWPMFRALLDEISAYEDRAGYRDAYRVTPRMRPRPKPKPPEPTPTATTLLSSTRRQALEKPGTVRYAIYARGAEGSPGPIGYVIRRSRPKYKSRYSIYAGSFPPRTDAPLTKPRYSGQRYGETDVEFFNRMRRSQAEEAVRVAGFTYRPRKIRYPEAIWSPTQTYSRPAEPGKSGRTVEWRQASVDRWGVEPPVMRSVAGGALAYRPIPATQARPGIATSGRYVAPRPTSMLPL